MWAILMPRTSTHKGSYDYGIIDFKKSKHPSSEIQIILFRNVLFQVINANGLLSMVWN